MLASRGSLNMPEEKECNSLLLKCKIFAGNCSDKLLLLSSPQSLYEVLYYIFRRSKDGSLREKLTALKDRLYDELGKNERGRGMFAKKIPSFGLTAKDETKSWLDPCLEECGHLLEDTVQLFHQRLYYILKHFGKVI